MTAFRIHILFLSLLWLFFSCNIQNKGKKELNIDPTESLDTFSIRTIVKDFQNDASITEVKGVQVDQYFLYVEYCVYVAKRNRALTGVNKIVAKQKADYTSDGKCSPVSKDEFYNSIVPDEKRKELDFFWRFENLKGYKIYKCIKAPLRHYIIFDNNSDTVYHRIEELRD